MKIRTYTGPEIKAIRRELKITQAEFWAHFGTTQSGGCRYESGREIPSSVQILLNMATGTEKKAVQMLGLIRGALEKRIGRAN